MSAGRIRSLAPSEQIFAMAGAYIGYSVRVRGELDIAALTTAFALLRRRYPVLAAVLEPEGGGHAIVARPGPLPGVVVTTGEIGAPMSGVCADQTRALSGLHVALDGERAAVTLFTHHSIADGYHSFALLADLWSLYTDTVGGNPVDAIVWDYPQSLEQMLAERGIVKADNGIAAEPVEQGAAGETPAPVIPGPAVADRVFTSAAARFRLSADATAALLAYARSHETTLNGVVSAAIMRVESELRGIAPERIKYSYPVNLRTRVEPIVPDQAATDPLGFAEFVPSGDLTDLAALARAVTDALRKGLDSQEIHQAGLSFFDNMSAAIARLMQLPEDERPIAVVSTNWGLVPPLRSPAGLEFDDFRSVMNEPPFDPDAPIGPPGTWILSSFQDRLAIELRGPFDAETAQKRVAAVESVLLTLD
ncbi:hypothetical protein H0264_22540 [Nocardia huaxiensis]|uniref:Phthiocerol/phthiodiolone dimycocerosyl transferase n=1 Tax=Nocardia huaxiensis TaxID=2755382 RepID=A0A7D6ZTD5_9NOCA|nr:hypothetical protein [Nocardia huaxiensis]QLY28169.1 hypothetical protein H0264_22540 [Nocardia huaxiensis]